ncbi:MAG: hypothetical protein K5891_07935 [Lachnospiraceae bacterium]|nr:hypothetical protein [Lachnospiraceae bacterium]
MVKARFHLPGIRYNFPLNMFWASLLKQYPEYFREGVEIASFFGTFPLSLWNGGRLVYHDQCDAAFVKNVIKNVNAQGIPIRYTFTNPLLTEEDLLDPFCNFCMKEADNGMNEVIVVSPILEQYIRDVYPSFAINSSTCKEIRDVDGINAELAKDYKTVVLDYNMNGRWDLIDGIEDKSRLEVLINTLCKPGCERRGGHYRNIAENQRIALKNRELPPEKRIPIKPWYCEYGDKNCVFTIQDYSTVIHPDAIWDEYIPRGINQFKIEGRTANLFSLIETYSYYMLKPECIGPARLLLLRNLEENKIITVNKPRPAKWP